MSETPPVTPPVIPPVTPPPPAPPWYQGKADQETIGHWQNKGWKLDDPAAVAIEATKQARELQRHFGVPAEQLIKLPATSADEAGWKAVHQRLGVPAEAKDYEFAGIKFGDGTELEAGFTDAMRNAMLAARVPKDAAPAVIKAVVKYLDDGKTSAAAVNAAKMAAEKATLDQAWGQNKDFNLLTAMQGAKRLGIGDAQIEALKNVAGGAAVMEMFRKVGAATSEDTFVEGSRGSLVTTTPGAASRKAELMSDPEWARRYLGGSAKEVQEMQALNTLIAGAA